MSCIICGDVFGDMITINNNVRNVTSQKFEYLGKEAHPKCLGLELCGCGKSYVKKQPCRHQSYNHIPVI